MAAPACARAGTCPRTSNGGCSSSARLPGFPFAVDWLPDGRMLVISGHDRRVVRRERDGSITNLVDLRAVCDYAWSEIVVDGRGNTYVNSIGFDFMAGEQPPPAPGVVAL